MRNEKGVTLIELIASVTVSIVVLAAASMLFMSMNAQSKEAVQQTVDTAGVKRALDLIDRQMVDSVSVNLVSTSELRYVTGLRTYKALLFQPSAGSATGTLSVYDFSNDGDTSNDTSDFTSTAISISATPSKYTNRIELATNAVSFPSISYSDGSTLTGNALSYLTLSPSTGKLNSGQALQFTLTFLFTQTGSHTLQKSYTTVLKLLQDY